MQITLNLTPNGYPPKIDLKQFDQNGKTLTAYLIEDGTEYSIPSGSTVTWQGTKPDGYGFSYSCTYSGNLVTIPITAQSTAVHGKVNCELMIESGADSSIRTATAIMVIAKAALDTSTIISGDDYQSLQSYVTAAAERAAAAADSASTATTKANAASTSASAAATSATNASTSATNSSNSATAAAASASSAASSATTATTQASNATASATAAASSASSADTSKTSAAGSATAAANSATAAATSKTNAAESATAAASSASSADTSKTSAAGSATAAANSATAAATSKTNAAESATAAAASASSANTSKTSAAGSATAAAASAAAAEESASTIDVSNFPPKSHASSGTAYGKGSGAQYGHLKLSNLTNSSNGIDDGTAATPYAVKTAYDKGVEAKTAADSKAPKSHASAETTYGKSTWTYYGHTRLEDATDSTSDKNGGFAATPYAVKKTWDLAAGKAPISHASSNTTYGKGDVLQYGHLKLSGLTNSTSGVNDGTAATPYAVKVAYDKANAAMPKSGGTFSGTVNASYVSKSGSCLRNTTVKNADGTYVSTESFSFTRK